MRESIGGAALYYIFAVFLIVLAVVIGLTINYMSAYRTNNYLVSMIEQHNGNIGDVTATVSERYGYNLRQDLVDACVLEVSGNNYINGGVVVRIYTYLRFRLPLIPVNIPITVRGETRTIQGTSFDQVKKFLEDSKIRVLDNCR